MKRKNYQNKQLKLWTDEREKMNKRIKELSEEPVN